MYLICVLIAGCAQGNVRRDPEAALRAGVDSMLPALERISGLQALRPVNVALRSADQVRSFVEARMLEEFPLSDVDGIQTAYSLLGLLPDTLDLRALLADLYAEQIVGYYDPDSSALYVIEGVPADALQPVLAHELVHALQDQHIDLDSLIARERGNDRQLAAQAAIEGHATLVMLSILGGSGGEPIDPANVPDPSAQLRAGLSNDAAFPVFRDAPELLREVLLFPYAQGASFMWSVWARAPAGQRPALTELIPQSTEQVLHPVEKFLERDAPTDVTFATVPEAPWRIVYENTFGALESLLFLQIRAQMMDAASGWDGDRYRVLEDEDGVRALLWVSVWDDARSADDFAAATLGVLETRSNTRTQVTRVDAGRPVVVVVVRAQGLDPAAVPAARIRCDDSACVIG